MPSRRTSSSPSDLTERPGAVVATLGCKVNRAESERIARMLERRGFDVRPFGRPARLVIVNTCTVTGRADSQSWQMARRVRRLYPDAATIVCGCAVRLSPDPAAGSDDIPGVTFIPATGDEALAALGRWLDAQTDPPPTAAPAGPARQTRPFVRVQDGCNSFCAWCAVPHARGGPKSTDSETVAAEVATLFESGCHEVVLTGIHLGRYGRDLTPATGLESLLERLLAIPFSGRIRLSSLEAAEIGDRLVALLASDRRVCPHIHIPIQSGDDRLLARMGRTAGTAEVVSACARIVEALPEAAIGADVIAGLPGEDDDSFARTRALLAGLPLAYLHIFPYSRRNGTAAADFPDQVPSHLRRARVLALRAIDREKRTAFLERARGVVHEVVIERPTPGRPGESEGLTGNYIRVSVPTPDRFLIGERGRPAWVRLTGPLSDRLSAGVLHE